MNAGLAMWVLAASTCGAVAHAHDGGAAPHSHHLGLLSLGDGAGSPADGSAFHRHLVLLGIETGSMPDPDPDDDEPQPPAHVAVGLGTVAVAAADALMPFDPTPGTVPPLAVVPPPPVEPTSPPPAGAPAVCAKAALARSGVRLA